MRTRLFLVLPLLLMFSLTGCASTSIDFSSIREIPDNEGVVFGRLAINYEGRDINQLTTILGERAFHLFLLKEGSSVVIDAPLENDGYFFWHLPNG